MCGRLLARRSRADFGERFSEALAYMIAAMIWSEAIDG
jgi:hypothetical protein